MGIVINQSIKNLVFTYLGFGIGAINTLFLYPYILDENYYGLVAVLLSTSMIIYPLLSLGMSNAIIRFYSRFETKKEKDQFVSFTFILPLLIIIPLWILTDVFETEIANSLSDKSELVKDYIKYIFIFAVFMGYFEVFYAYTKVLFKSVFGNMLKEISIRIYVSILIVLIYFDIITDHEFIVLLAIGYGVRVLIIAIYILLISGFKFQFSSFIKYKNVLLYSLFVVFSASVSFVVLEIDKLMISQIINLENVAYYAVGGYIGIVVSVPGRAMVQILAPFVAKALTENNLVEISSLYRKSSINLLVVSGFIFIMIVVNVKFLFMLLPEKYAGGELVAIIIALSKLFDMATGINGTIITNSKYYKFDFAFGGILLILTIVTNIMFLNAFGTIGAAIATGLSVVFYNVIKLSFVKIKYGVYPFSINSLFLVSGIALIVIAFYFVPMIINPIVTIIILSTLVGIIYLFFIFKLKPSADIDSILNKTLKTLFK